MDYTRHLGWSRRLLILACVLLVGWVVVAEAVHLHPLTPAPGKAGSPAAHCSLCLVAHTTVAAAVISLPEFAAPTQGVVFASDDSRPAHDEVIQLFVRPPPAV